MKKAFKKSTLKVAHTLGAVGYIKAQHQNGFGVYYSAGGYDKTARHVRVCLPAKMGEIKLTMKQAETLRLVLNDINTVQTEGRKIVNTK